MGLDWAKRTDRQYILPASRQQSLPAGDILSTVLLFITVLALNKILSFLLSLLLLFMLTTDIAAANHRVFR